MAHRDQRDRSSLSATQCDRPRREPARLAISTKDRTAAFGNTSATSGAIATTFELVRSRSMYCPRTNRPKSERLYSERSSSATTFLAFLIERPLSPRRKASGNHPNCVVAMYVSGPQPGVPKSKIVTRSRKRIEEHARSLVEGDPMSP